MGVGVLATGLDVALLSTLVYGAKLDARLASPIALAAGVALQFVGNKLVAFRDRSPRWAGQAARFLAVEAAGFMANLALFDVAVRALPVPVPILRLATTAVVYFTVCLPLWARIFQAPAAPTLAE
jgi:putative flippase GtrA